MLFNSYVFIFAFLPTALILFGLARKYSRHASAPVAVLAFASLVFYGYASLAFLAIFLISMLANGLVVFALGRTTGAKRVWLCIAGVSLNLLFIGYFKYRDFFIEAIQGSFEGGGFSLVATALPIGISFYTFQQIAYIVDAYKGKTGAYDPLRHLLFISFFPQLIAGPIVHHREMMPQFARNLGARWKYDIAVGISIFSVGLFKKVVIADGIAPVSDAMFLAAESGAAIAPVDAWTGALAFSFQLYFDFSGYSDMAIGLARMFGIVLPLNFFSPYKAASIIEFWRRWHITLSRFLRDYLYVPLGGNRHGTSRRYLNIAIVMTLGGLWHGAGWTFVVWGMLHGALIIVNHLWRALPPVIRLERIFGTAVLRPVFISLTFFSVVVAWVPFRAVSFEGTLRIYTAMLNLFSGAGLESAWHAVLELRLAVTQFLFLIMAAERGFVYPNQRDWKLFDVGDITVLLLIGCAVVVFAMPNTCQIFRHANPVLKAPELNSKVQGWRMSAGWAFFVALLFVAAVLNLTAVSPFLYFQF